MVLYHGQCSMFNAQWAGGGVAVQTHRGATYQQRREGCCRPPARLYAGWTRARGEANGQQPLVDATQLRPRKADAPPECPHRHRETCGGMAARPLQSDSRRQPNLRAWRERRRCQPGLLIACLRLLGKARSQRVPQRGSGERALQPRFPCQRRRGSEWKGRHRKRPAAAPENGK